jgi:hypothetical protein
VVDNGLLVPVTRDDFLIFCKLPNETGMLGIVLGAVFASALPCYLLEELQADDFLFTNIMRGTVADLTL